MSCGDIPMIKIWMRILVIYCCYHGSVSAEAIDIDLKYYNKANYYLGQGNFKQASKQWHQLSVVFLRSEAKLGYRKMWLYAGLADALAAIAADKANDVVAYQYWADSTRYLMTGGTNWSLVQKQLHGRFETTNTQLSAFMQVNDFAMNDSDRWQQDLAILQIWNDKLALFTFTAPKLGLNGRAAVIDIPAQQPVVNYKGPFQPNKKLTGLGASSFRGNQITPIKTGPQLSTDIIQSRVKPVSPNNTSEVTEFSEEIPSTDFSAVSSSPPLNDSAAVETFESQPLVELDEIDPKNTEPVIPAQPNPLARGSMATIEEKNVEALQRRSFAPTTAN